MNPGGELIFSDLLYTLAERMGWHKRPTGADNRGQLPDDPYLLDRLKRAINDGRREAYRRMLVQLPSAPCFRPRLIVTTDPTGTGPTLIEGDKAKYRLPFAVQGLAGGEWRWSLASNSGYGGSLQQRSANALADLHLANSTGSLASSPLAMAFALQRNADPSEPGRRTQWFMWIYPVPDQVYTLEGPARVMYEPMVGLNDIEPMGNEHSETIITAGEWAIKLNHPDKMERQDVNARLDLCIVGSAAVEVDKTPQTLGVGYDPDTIRKRGTSPWPDTAAMVTHLNGVPIPGV